MQRYKTLSLLYQSRTVPSHALNASAHAWRRCIYTYMPIYFRDSAFTCRNLFFQFGATCIGRPRSAAPEGRGHGKGGSARRHAKPCLASPRPYSRVVEAPRARAVLVGWASEGQQRRPYSVWHRGQDRVRQRVVPLHDAAGDCFICIVAIRKRIVFVPICRLNVTRSI